MSLFETDDRELPANVELDRGFLARDTAGSLFATLRETVAWRQDHARMFGKPIRLPRLTAWHGDPGAGYLYSGIANEPLPWTPELARLRELVESAAGARFNSVLLNLYRDGNDSVGWHADDEPELGQNPLIASLSLGHTRTFRFRHNETRRTISVVLDSGSLLVMRGSIQHEWQHCLPKTKRAVGPRINLTFRWIVVG